MKNGGVFETDLARKSIGIICELREHLCWFCHVFHFSGVLDSEILGDGVADDTSATTGCNSDAMKCSHVFHRIFSINDSSLFHLSSSLKS